MKKIFLAAIFMMIAAFSFQTKAQEKGDFAVGAHLNYGGRWDNFGLGIKGQYNITDLVRIAPSLDYYVKKHGFDVYGLTIDAHYLIRLFDGVNIYPLAGVAFQSWGVEKIANEKISNRSSETALNLGAGAEFPIGNQVSFDAEAKYQVVDNFSQWVISVGLKYTF